VRKPQTNRSKLVSYLTTQLF